MAKPPLTITDLARLGGLARAKALTKAERIASATAAAQERWKGHKPKATPTRKGATT